jgi:predicted Zn-dependent peptidase
LKHTIEEVKLPNGARGLLIDIPGATVMSFQFQFRAGNCYVRNKDIYETAHVMEHMAFGANAQFKSEHEYEAEFTKNGLNGIVFSHCNVWQSVSLNLMNPNLKLKREM